MTVHPNVDPPSQDLGETGLRYDTVVLPSLEPSYHPGYIYGLGLKHGAICVLLVRARSVEKLPNPVRAIVLALG